MSGPKISVYSLTGRAREIVVGQISCERQSIACAAQVQDMLSRVQALTGVIEQAAANADLAVRRAGQDAGVKARFQDVLERLKREAPALQKALKAQMPHASPKYFINEEALRKKQEQLRRLLALKEQAEALKDAVEEAAGQGRSSLSQVRASILADAGVLPPEPEAARFMSRDAAGDTGAIRRSISDDLAGAYSFEQPEDEPAPFAGRRAADLARLEALAVETGLPESLRMEARNAAAALARVSDDTRLRTFEAVTLRGLLDRAADERRAAEEKQAAFSQARREYEALCAMAGEAPRPFDGPDAAAMRAETERLAAELTRRAEQAYISQCVDEVMADMGYDLIGRREVRKKSGRHFRNELFTFDEGTAVNVTFDSDGQIAMELGGLAREDRVPTEDETVLLTREMESFCGEFAEFERRLREKGVLAGRRVALSPPTAEYAAIINVNDYDTAGGAPVTELAAAETKRRAAAQKKTLRRDE